jgi:hypothetical protein
VKLTLPSLTVPALLVTVALKFTVCVLLLKGAVALLADVDVALAPSGAMRADAWLDVSAVLIALREEGVSRSSNPSRSKRTRRRIGAGRTAFRAFRDRRPNKRHRS